MDENFCKLIWDLLDWMRLSATSKLSNPLARGFDEAWIGLVERLCEGILWLRWESASWISWAGIQLLREPNQLRSRDLRYVWFSRRWLESALQRSRGLLSLPPAWVCVDDWWRAPVATSTRPRFCSWRQLVWCWYGVGSWGKNFFTLQSSLLSVDFFNYFFNFSIQVWDGVWA